MDQLFFIFSKLAWALISPSNLLIIFFLLGTIFLLLGWANLARRILVWSSLFGFAVLAYPVGDYLIEPLEKRFSQPSELPEHVDGIILLGGAELLKPSLSWQQPELGSAADRYIATAKLAKLYPKTPVLFSGGNNLIRFQRQGDEGHIAPQVLTTIGVKEQRLIIEDKARNTHENFVLLKPLLPKKSGRYLLVTSAFHMPRAVAIARQQGIDVVAYPVDFRSSSAELRQWDFSLFEHLEVLEPAWKEWIGLTVYFWTGRTSEWLASEQPTKAR